MTDPIADALERLTGFNAWIRQKESPCAVSIEIDKELAALIRKASRPTFERNSYICHACRWEEGSHAPDCALLAMCRVITGSKV